MRIAIALFLMVACARADWTAPQVRYWAHEQGVTDDTSGVEVSLKGGIEGGWENAWGKEPTKAQCEAVDYKTALAWCRTTDKAKLNDKEAPDTGWANLSRKERFMIRVCYRLAKELHPALTLDQFKTQIRSEWDATE